MAFRGSQSGGALPKPGILSAYENFRPLSEWNHGSEAQPHFLLILLPGFVKEQIKVSTEGTNTLRIRGERLIGGNKWSRFEEDFRIPEDCNIRGIRAKFESGTLTITMPKKAPTIAQVSPKNEESPQAQLEAPLGSPANEKWPAKIEQQIRENIAKVVEKVKEPKKDEHAREDSSNKAKDEIENGVNANKAKEVDDRKGKEMVKPEIYFGKIEKPAEEKMKQAKEFLIEKSKKVMEGINSGKETKEEGTLTEHDKYFPKTEKKVDEKSGALKEYGKEKYKEVMEGFNIGNKTEDDVKGKRYSKTERNIKKVAKKAKGESSRMGEENAKKKHQEIAIGQLKEEKQLMVNMGVAVVVIVALGVSISYGMGFNWKAKN